MTLDLVPSYPVIQKTAGETKTLTFDFTPELAPGTTLTTPTVTVENAPGSPPLSILDVALDGTSTLILVLVTSGGMGGWGLVRATGQATDGQVHEIAAVVSLAPVN